MLDIMANQQPSPENRGRFNDHPKGVGGKRLRNARKLLGNYTACDMVYSAPRKTQQLVGITMPKGGHRPNCTFGDCTEPHVAKGLCRLHYARWKSGGHPDSGRKVEVGATLLEKATKKFLRGIRKLESGCWTCDTAYKTRAGYLHLQITEDGVQHAFKVHRFSYEHFKGPIPEGKFGCHKCDMRWCCNPDHVFPGTQSDNMQDMVRKGRGLVGEKSARTKFTEADVLGIYQDVDAGLTRKAIAAKHGVKAVTISHIATGRNWKHLYERHRVSSHV